MNGTRQSSGLRLGSIAGTEIFIEISFLILVGLFVVLALEGGSPLPIALLWIPVLLISVLFHEVGHATLIGIFGFGGSTIVLGGFGGVTINQRRSQPWKEIVISISGPGFSVLLALLFATAWNTVPLFQTDPMLAALVPLMVRANIFWAIFNLVPLYPLDGGQALQNLLRYVVSERRALFVSIWLSIGLGVILLVLGLFSGQFFLAIIAAMLSMQNWQRWRIYRGFQQP